MIFACVVILCLLLCASCLCIECVNEGVAKFGDPTDPKIEKVQVCVHPFVRS